MWRRLAIIALGVFPSCLRAQTITVRLINAENGKPIANKNVSILGGLPAVVLTDKDGAGRFQAFAREDHFALMPGPRIGKEPGRVAYLNCNGRGDLLEISVKKVMESGFLPENVCSKKSFTSAKPGEVVFFAKLLPWWMPDMQ